MWENSLWIASKIRGTYKKKPKNNMNSGYECYNIYNQRGKEDQQCP